MTLRPGIPEDVRAVLELERGVGTAPHWAEAEYRAMLGAQDSEEIRRCLFVASGQVLVGFAVGKVFDEEAEIESVAVGEDVRRQGLGRALCRAVMEWAAGEGARSIGLEVRARSVGAIALYGGLGFVEVGRRPGYYERPADDAVVMRGELG